MRTLIALWLVLAPMVARAEVYKLYVAERDSAAQKSAEALADGKTSLWFPKLARAIEKAVELLNNTDNEVQVLVAQGKQTGLWALPNGLAGDKGKLLLLGGHCPDWKKRDPFGCPTELFGGEVRPQAIFSFGGNKTSRAGSTV